MCELSEGPEDLSAISSRRCRHARVEKHQLVKTNLNLGSRCWPSPEELPLLSSVVWKLPLARRSKRGDRLPPSTLRTWLDLFWGSAEALFSGTSPDWVASARCRCRSCLAAIPSGPWRNSSNALPLRATWTLEFLAWRLSGELREEPVSLPVRDYPRREDPIILELQIDFSFIAFILLSFSLVSRFVYVASGSREAVATTFRPRLALPSRLLGSRTW